MRTLFPKIYVDFYTNLVKSQLFFYSQISDHPLDVIFITCEQYVNVCNKHFKKHCTDITIRHIRLYYIYIMSNHSIIIPHDNLMLPTSFLNMYNYYIFFFLFFINNNILSSPIIILNIF